MFMLQFYFNFWPCFSACEVLVPQLGIKSGPRAVKAPSPNHWTTREFPTSLNRVVGKVTLRNDISSKVRKQQGREAPN